MSPSISPWRARSGGSDLRHAAVDEELGAGDVAAVVRRKEEDGLRNLVGASHAAHGHGPDDVRLELLELRRGQPEVVVAGRVDGTGADDIDTDFSALQVDGPAAREGPDGGLGGAVDAEGLHA